MMVVLPRPAGAWCVQDSLHWAADGTDWTGKLTMLHPGGGGSRGVCGIVSTVICAVVYFVLIADILL
jgi:hypothetical protein